jgi:signal transduction histidine kinase
LERCDIGGVWWKSLVNPHPVIFVLLIVVGILSEIVFHFLLGITIVYTHFYYLIIVVAGLWYGRNAVWAALFFGSLHIIVSWILTGGIPPDAFVRALMMVIVAFVIGTIVEQTRCYYNQILEQNHELNDINEEMRILNEQLKDSEEAFQTANRKLNLLSSITRHDIRNQLLALMGYIELSKAMCTDPKLLEYIEREDTATQAIRRQIEFTKDYEELGVHTPKWQNLEIHLTGLQSLFPPEEIEISVNVDGLEIFSDPLLEKVFENLIDNARRHGERVRHISFSSAPRDPDALAIVYEDDGIGIPEADKQRIFEKGFGRHTGLGLFLSREILAITGLSITESGVYEKGARFEILVPKGKFRFAQPPTSPG